MIPLVVVGAALNPKGATSGSISSWQNPPFYMVRCDAIGIVGADLSKKNADFALGWTSAGLELHLHLCFAFVFFLWGIFFPISSPLSLAGRCNLRSRNGILD